MSSDAFEVGQSIVPGVVELCQMRRMGTSRVF
jgi:hypothetical protein